MRVVRNIYSVLFLITEVLLLAGLFIFIILPQLKGQTVVAVGTDIMDSSIKKNSLAYFENSESSYNLVKTEDIVAYERDSELSTDYNNTTIGRVEYMENGGFVVKSDSDLIVDTDPINKAEFKGKFSKALSGIPYYITKVYTLKGLIIQFGLLVVFIILNLLVDTEYEDDDDYEEENNDSFSSGDFDWSFNNF